MNNLIYILIIAFFIGNSTTSFGQGCSDAGACSVGALGIVKIKFEKLPYAEFKLDIIEIDSTNEEAINILNPKNISSEENSNPKRKDRSSLNRRPKFVFSYFSSYGRGVKQTDILTQQVEATYFYNQNLSAQIKLPYHFINGRLGSNSGVGDVTASLSYSIINKPKKSFSLVGGIKIPINNANLSKNNLPLPMVYQTSLGTNDLIFGMNYRFSSWDLTFAYQHPLNANKNEYLHNNFQNLEYNSFSETRNLRRADDAVLRLNKIFKIKKLSLSTGLLGIYHMKNDQFQNLNNQTITINKSEGLTLNFNFSSVYPISKKIDFLIIYANPLLIRDVRPAGLARDVFIMGGIRLKTF
jgi:hypothetical protein